MKEENTIIRISDIARLAGVSAGTVDRVLHNRGRVSDEKRAKVEQVLQEINYRPNPLARTLANKRKYRFITLTPEYRSGEYWEQVNDGIRHAAQELTDFNITVDQVYFDQYDQLSFSCRVEKLLQQEVDGVVIAALFDKETIALSEKLDNAGIPYVFIDSNIEGCHNLTYFGVDSYQSGKVAARLMLQDEKFGMTLLSVLYEGENGELSLQSRLREKGFRDYLSENGYHGTCTSLLLRPHRHAGNKDLLSATVAETNPEGIIVFNSRIYEVAEMLTEAGGIRRRMIGYDLIDANKQALLDGKITYLIGQRAEIQGYDAVKALSNRIIFGETIEKIHFMPIDILLRENVAYHHNFNL
ncbi:MAG: substrate-binding domain-containing protein [Bacteroidales bacterium]